MKRRVAGFGVCILIRYDDGNRELKPQCCGVFCELVTPQSALLLLAEWTQRDNYFWVSTTTPHVILK
jgi:hypothetical protein